MIAVFLKNIFSKLSIAYIILSSNITNHTLPSIFSQNIVLGLNYQYSLNILPLDIEGTWYRRKS